MEDRELYEQIVQTQFISENMRNQVLGYFDRLTQLQKQVISEGILAEKSILLQFLSTLTTHSNIPPSQIKTVYQNYKNHLLSRYEHEEEKYKQDELNDLLEEIQSIS